jgi:tRNA G26 N,N-dimethylase Trm1
MRKEAKDRNLRLGEKISKLLHLISDESEAPATYYVMDKICDKFNLSIPSLSKVMDELRKLGFQAVATHFNTKAVRTNATAQIVKEIVTRLSGSKTNHLSETK